jgi:hypothetical protein
MDGRGCCSAGDATKGPAPADGGPSVGGTGYTPTRVDELLRRKNLHWSRYFGADSACFVLPSPVTLTADIAAGGAARQDDRGPGTESSACRPPTSAIHYRIKQSAVVDGLMALARLGTVPAVRLRPDLFQLAVEWVFTQPYAQEMPDCGVGTFGERFALDFRGMRVSERRKA